MHARYATGGYTQAEPWLLMIPRRPGVFPLIVTLHGAGGDEAFAHEPASFPNAHATFKALVAAGFMVMSIDYRDGISADGSHTWGNDGSTTTIDNAITYAKASLGAPALKVAFLPTSMGNIAAWNYYRRFPANVAGICAVSGASDLAYHHAANNNPVGQYQTEINTAYGGGAGYTAAEATHDPAQFAPALADLPYRHYHASDDTVAPYAKAQTFVPAVGGTLVTLASGGHTDSAWGLIDLAALVGFFQGLSY